MLLRLLPLRQTIERTYILMIEFETEMQKLFQSRKLLASGTAITAPDTKIIFTKAPFVQYEQMLLDKNFRQYLETIMVSKKKSLGWVLKKH